MKTKYLCICQGGNSRSVAMAYVLKYALDGDALSCSAEKNTSETIKMLGEWADKIIIMQPGFIGVVPLELRDKVLCVNVGPDVWCNGLHPDLANLCGSKFAELVK
jgi:hypothetical protein